MVETTCSARKARGTHALWLPGLVLLGIYLLFFALLHLRSLGWAPGLLFNDPQYYWEFVEALIGPKHLFIGREDSEALQYRWLLAGVFLMLNATFLAALLRVRRYPGGISLRSIIGWAAFFSLPLILLPNLLSNDLYSYILFGRIPAIHGGNPFIEVPAQFSEDPYLRLVHWRQMASVYGPVWIHISYALTWCVEMLGGGLWLYQLAYKLIGIISHLINIVLIWAILGRWKPQQQLWGAVLYGWNPLALIEFAGSAHNDTIMITLLLLAIWLHLLRRPYLAILALVSAALLKWVVAALLPLYGILLLREARSWREGIRLTLLGSATALSASLLIYAPYWEGMPTLDVLKEAPPSTMAINSLGDMVIHEVQYQRWLKGQGPHPWEVSRRPVLPTLARLGRIPIDDMNLEEQFKREQRVLSNQQHQNTSEVLLRKHQMEATEKVLRLLGGGLFVLVWLWWAWQIRSLDLLVRGWAWVLFTYVVFSSIWFWPWYVTWFVALAALLDWRRTALTALVFSASVVLLYVTYPTEKPPLLLERYRALLLFGPPLVYLALTMIFRLNARQTSETAAARESSTQLRTG